MSSTQVRNQIDSFAACETPLGTIFVAYNDTGVSMVQWQVTEQQFIAQWRQRFNGYLQSESPAPSWLDKNMTVEFTELGQADWEFDLQSLTAFEQQVLHATCTIPRGEVRTYGWVAAAIGNPKAVRAVGTALGHNPIPLLIPCHRIVRSGGVVGHYSGGAGTPTKCALLEREGVNLATLKQ